VFHETGITMVNYQKCLGTGSFSQGIPQVLEVLTGKE